jgi:hypothetical protein
MNLETDDIPQVSQEENNLLIAPYIEEKYVKRFSKWSIIILRVRMTSHMSSISLSRMLLSQTCLLYLVTSIRDN